MSRLPPHMYAPKRHLLDGFSNNCDVVPLDWFMEGGDISFAIELEMTNKTRGRPWKIHSIEKSLFNWTDFAATDGFCSRACTQRVKENRA